MKAQKEKKVEAMNIEKDIHYDWLINNCTSGEGNLLTHTKEDVIIYQTDFLIKYLKTLNPKKILEIGTNCCCFGYLVKKILPEAQIITIGIDSWSSQFVNYLNEAYGNYITFVHGDSQIVMNNVKDTDIGFAWVDGCHHKSCLLSDLNHCNRLNISDIFIDDHEYGPVSEVVQEFLNNNKNYILKDVLKNTIQDITRDIAYIQKLDQ
jgi:hypothetical protein